MPRDNLIYRSALLRKLIIKRDALYRLKNDKASVYSKESTSRIALRLRTVNECIQIVRGMPAAAEDADISRPERRPIL